ncbi:DUF2919 domain-containing protein [Erwinia sp. Leaf53]|uniref:DUF2919 domain-containing protein n=1 Tax=Erwinia sp. Leaf53 TaxID=1736225 RepID=UPI0006FF719B|nr:DUF2919 domain-containing protein [Erwinia sp. Leaf53]KQN54956.1 hypothetical protein ASF13_11000 [Erwinia sp. Leaf53]
MNYSPDDYDNKGQLRLPLSFWAILLLQARTWVLFVVAGASRQQGASLLELFYPDTHAFWLGLALGLPAAAGLLLTGYRQRLPRLWQAWRWVLCATLLVMLALQAALLWQGDEPPSPPVIGVMLLDVLALCALLWQRRLRDCLDPLENQ